jgi:hypothetical protein
VQLNPTLGESDTPPEVRTIQEEAKRVQALKNESICKCCLQLKKIDEWTALDLASMAKIAGKQLEDLYRQKHTAEPGVDRCTDPTLGFQLLLDALKNQPEIVEEGSTQF